ncbi:hypothetical protein PJL18_02505 [Paenarthrobacter nicotinovorans]|nr:hypothetical protein [Paenarthrobacter nicotinovorans]
MVAGPFCLSAGCSVPQTGGACRGEAAVAETCLSPRRGCRGEVAGGEGAVILCALGRSSLRRALPDNRPLFRRLLTSLGLESDACSHPEGLNRTLAHIRRVSGRRLLTFRGFGPVAWSRSAGMRFDGGCWVGCVGVRGVWVGCDGVHGGCFGGFGGGLLGWWGCLGCVCGVFGWCWGGFGVGVVRV